MDVTGPTLPVTMTDHLSPRARASALARQDHCEAARQGGDDNELYLSARNMASSINMRIGSATSELLEWDMHDLWHLYYQASMNIFYLHPGIDRLALQVIQLRCFDPSTHVSANSQAQSRGLTSGGYVWRDLPYFVEDMTRYWVENHSSMSSAERLSFAQFLAKTAAAGVSNNAHLCHIALLTLRDALETPRPLGTAQDQEQTAENSRRSVELSVATLLPAMNAWLSQANLKIVMLCENSWNEGDPSINELGPLLQNNSAAEWQGISSGFSPKRWVYWLHRLQDLARSARDSDEILGQFITGVMNNMIIAADEASVDRLSKDLEAAYSAGLLVRLPMFS